MARMVWFATDARVHQNQKVLDLAEDLKVDVDTCVGKLCCLWAWAKINEVEDGRIGRLPASEIAAVMRWPKKPDRLLDALLEHRFLDLEDDGSLRIHDWYGLNGKLSERARKDRIRKQTYSEENPQEIP